MMQISDRKFLFGLIAAHAAIALAFGYFLNIWADEASTLYSTQNGIAHAIRNAAHDEKQAPLYFWILSLWREINSSIFFARAFSVICSAAAIGVFYALARKFFEKAETRHVTALFAFHSYLFWASLEIRLYSMVILVTAALLYFFADGYLTTGVSDMKRSRRIYTMLAVAALYVNYYTGFLLVGAFAALLASGRRQQAKIYFRQMLFVLLTIAPLVFFVKRQLGESTGFFIESRTIFDGVRMLWGHCLTFILPTEIIPGAETSFVSIIRVWMARAAVAGVVFALIKNKGKNITDDLLIFGTISAVVLTFLLIVYFITGAEYITVRHSAVLFVPLLLFAAALFFEIVPKKLRIIFALVYTFFLIYGLFSIYPNFTKRGDWARVGAFIEQNEKPLQPIVVFEVYEAIALPFHYRGINEILPDRRFFDFGTEAEPGGADSFKNQIEFVISEIPPEAAEIWLVTNEKCDVKDSCLPLENFVQANYTVVREKEFYLEKVRLLRKKKS